MSVTNKLRFALMRDFGLAAALKGRDLYKRLRRKPRPYPEWLGPPLQCNGRLRSIMTRHYLLAKYAEGAMPVAWVTSGAPVELLRVLGYYTVYPENHGAVCGARKVGVAMSEPAERAGYSPDLCSYARVDLGQALGADSPVGRLPRPDVLICSTNICQTVLHWYKQLAWLYGVPLLLFDTPFISGELGEADVVYMADQLRGLIPPLERAAGKAFDQKTFEEISQRSRRTSLLWGEALATMQARPAPMSIFDAFVHMAPVVSLRGLPVAEQYYETLVAELQERVKDGVGGLKKERFRLLWDNIAVWFKVAEFARMFGEAGGAFVAATYTNAWAETAHHLDMSTPFEAMAKAYSLVVLNRDLSHRVRLMKRIIEDYQIDGVLFHSTRSCKPYSVGQYDIQSQLARECGVSTAVVEADTTDTRVYAEGAANTRLEAFLEALEARGANG